MDSKGVVVLMVPFSSQGHLNQLLHLSCLISTQGVEVHYISTAAHCRQARRRVQGRDHVAISNIVFHEYTSLSFQSPPPDPHASVKFPSHLQPLFEASLLLREPVGELIRSLSATSRRLVIIHDSMMGSVIQDFVHLPNAESYTFHSVSAFSIFFFLWEKKGRPFSLDSEILEILPSLEGCFTPEFERFIGEQHQYKKLNSGEIYNTSRVIENHFFELLSRTEISEKRQWALGPFNPVVRTEESLNSFHKCIKWLDIQAPNSVIFVSFGTTTSLSNEEIRELAIGLEKSEVKFLWVLRDADRGDVFTGTGDDDKHTAKRLPRGFEEKNQEKGIIVRDWAPQLEILGHLATGGFLSHCGWNSCMESISMGVPIAAWPMHSDQPRNAVLITEILKIGVTVKGWGSGGESVRSCGVERALRKLMVSEEGDEMRRRAARLGGAVRNAVAEGGAAQLELESFISHINRH
ncbi:zeatin O-glucosyltransferase-like [Dorcoceras hygrometricum]|uniref:Glycosyltransferase n=1 Tax=Dorcoceras hygrometricum TaxID=472368 RepID=A0A2Z7C1K2_9LAMI|nr:zeatin O-glucosyltransferase-like [Dorcoceras hygrometricum]